MNEAEILSGYKYKTLGDRIYKVTPVYPSRRGEGLHFIYERVDNPEESQTTDTTRKRVNNIIAKELLSNE